MSDPRTAWNGRGSDDRKSVAVANRSVLWKFADLLPHARPCWCNECWNKYHSLMYRERQGLPLVGRIAKPRPCEGCGYSFTPADNQHKKARFCDVKCLAASKGNASFPDSSRVYWPKCYECGGVFGPYRERKSKWLCDTCRPVARSRAAKDIARRKNNKRRKAQMGERYRFRDIAERDGWRCHLCGKKVPDRPHQGRPLDPEIDHLIPVSAGGTDDPSNVALAHRRCNGARGADGPAQLRLTA